jgi:hypothetical protein
MSWLLYPNSDAFMIILDVPFEPTTDTLWQVAVSDGRLRQFASRESALVFALSEARSRGGQERGGSFVNIEGADGKWRLFDPELKSVL